MTIKTITNYLFIITILLLSSCKKLVDGSIKVNTSAISVNMNSGIVTQNDIDNNKNSIGVYVENNLDIDSILQIGVDVADKNNYITTKEQLLNGKINSVVVENRNSTDGRSFYSYFERIDGIFIKFSENEFNPSEEISVKNGFQLLCDTFPLLTSHVNKIEIQIEENKRNSLINYLNNTAPKPSEKRNLVVAIKGKCKNTIEEGNEFQLKITAKTLLTLLQKQ